MKINNAKALRNDGLLGTASTAFAVIAGLFVLQVTGVFPAEAIYNWIIALLMMLMAILMVWRMVWILSLFRHGTMIEGIVDKIAIYRNRGIVTFFFIKGETFVKTKQPIMRNKTTLALTPGQKVRILYDDKKLKRALILELYVETKMS